MKRICTTLFAVILAFGSLLTFPEYLPWLVFLWLSLALFAFANSRPMWPWLLTCVVIIIVKRPGFTVQFWVLILIFSAVGFVDWYARRKKEKSLTAVQIRLHILLLIAAATFFAAMRWLEANTTQQLVSDGRPIACLGDSLTASGYPQELAKMVAMPVVDFGVNGITTDEGIKMIPEVLTANPQLVVIELGGHDYNAEHKTRSATRANLIRLIESFREQDIAVILVEIPRGFLSDPYDGLERELAAKYDLQLIADSLIRSFIFNSPIMPPGMWLDPAKHYSDDGLHPNELGNKQFARTVSKSLTRIFVGSTRQ